MNPILAKIDAGALTYTPAVLAAIQAAEALAPAGTTGPTKFNVVMTALGAGSQALESAPNANVAGIAALVNLGVMIGNLFGGLFHKSKQVSQQSPATGIKAA